MERFKVILGSRWTAFTNKMRVRTYTLQFILGLLDEEVTIVSHNVGSETSDEYSRKVVKTFSEVVEFGRDIAQDGRYINGKLVEYVKTISVINWADKFMFVTLYKNA